VKFSNTVITSRTNPLVKLFASLSEKKGRNSERLFIAEGEKLCFEAIKASLPIAYILIEESRAEQLLPRIRETVCSEKYSHTELILLKESAFDKISTEKAPEGVITVIKYLDFFRDLDIIYKEEFFIPKGERTLALCSVRDPNNLGAVIRSAVAFGVKHLVLSADCADIYNPKTVRCAMGSLFKIKITRVRDLSSFIESAKAVGRRVFAAELREGAKAVGDISLTSDDIFMIGNEGHGIPEELSAVASASVYIPISELTESLNASVAAAIFMWEQNKSL